jgi:5-methylthioadenosine/S-adenosylhomocysteine deaminase
MAADGSPAEGVHTHLLESPAQRHYLDAWLGGSVVDWLDQLGFLSPAASFAHGVWLRPGEMELLAERGATVVHNPGSNLRVRNGIAPLKELRQAGVAVALGTDEMTLNDNDDLLAEARLAGILAGLTGADLEPAQLLQMATATGAAAAGFGKLTGVLASGMRADVVLVDAARLDEPAVTGDVPLLELLLARGLGSDVRTVLVDGEVLLDERRHSWIDREELVAELRVVARKQDGGLHQRETRDLAERLARAWDAYPKRVFSPLSR